MTDQHGRKKGRRLDRYVSDYVVFDLETTGIRQGSDAIIEISAIRAVGGREAAVFSTLVNPQRHIPRGATAVNGITDGMVKDAPTIDSAIRDFLAFTGDSVLVGHNIHSFDMNFLYTAAWDCLGRLPENDYIDTLYMARRCLPELGHHRLTDLSEYFGISTQGAHRALNDCRMNQRCYERMRELLAEQKCREKSGAAEKGLVCPSCGSPLVLRKGRFGAFYGCSSFPGCRHTQKA
ncbi:MAG: exonuclease domain-containing protein [Eubacteriales bacterium]|nr:exonuclease domain-containing protein [Eubacteriales bacterium]